MAGKINIPSVTGLNLEGMSFSTIVFLQAVEDALRTIDNKVVYKEDVTVVPNNPRIQKKSAQGQSFSVTGVNLASGDDYAISINDFEALLQSHIDLWKTVDQLVKEVRRQ